jgi:hypothetical protein
MDKVFFMVGLYHHNNSGEDGGFISARSTLIKPSPLFFEKLCWFDSGGNRSGNRDFWGLWIKETCLPRDA